LTKKSFKKNIKGKDITFDIYDSVTSFTKNDWKRVVGVFVIGPDWQFKDWPKQE